LLSEKKLGANVRVWAQAVKRVRKEFGKLEDEARRYIIIRTIIDMQIRDVVHTSEELIRKAGVQSADDVRRHPRALVQYGGERRVLNLELRDYLYKNLYYNPVVHQPNLRAVKVMGELFKYYLVHPDEIGGSARRRLKKVGLHRAVCDYLSGMTDRYVMQECERILGKKIKVV
jgi:dGTPase